jgi:hypothetical protein
MNPIIDDNHHAAIDRILVRRHADRIVEFSGPSAESAVDGRMDAVSTTAFDLTTRFGERRSSIAVRYHG